MHSPMYLAAGVSCLMSLSSAAVLPRASYLDTFQSAGCVQEPTLGRLLNGPTTTSNVLTYDFCAILCADYEYFGVENANRCYCGNTLHSEGTSVPLSQCDLPCTGNPAEDCGAAASVSLFSKIDNGEGNGDGNGGGNGGLDSGPFFKHVDNSVNIDDSLDNSSFLSPITLDKSRTGSPNYGNDIANGAHTLSSDTNVHNKQANSQGQSAAVNASPAIAVHAR